MGKRRFVSEVIAFVTVSNEVYFCYDEKKIIEKIKSTLDSGSNKYEQITSSIFELSLKILSSNKKSWGIKVRSNKFPSPTEWYTVMNLDIDCIYDIVTQVSNIQFGEVSGLFEPIFSVVQESNDTNVYFVTEDMEEYNSAKEETRRFLSVSLGKKTKKYIPGNRYDHETGSLVFLGEFDTRLLKIPSTSRMRYIGMKDNELDKINLFTPYDNRLEGKSISEIIYNGIYLGSSIPSGLNNTKYFPIIGTFTKSSLVNYGNVLTNDLNTTNFSEFYEDVLVNTREVMSYNPWPRVLSDNGKFIFDILSINSEAQDYKKSLGNSNIMEILFMDLVDTWIFSYRRDKLTSKDEFLNGLSSIICLDHVTRDSVKNLLYLIGFENSKAYTFLMNWKIKLLENDFDLYKKYNKIYSYKPTSIIEVNLRTSSSIKPGFQCTPGKISKSIKDDLVCINIINKCKDIVNNSMKDDKIDIYENNVGTSKNPRIYYTISFSTSDIIDLIGENLIPDESKKYLMDNKIAKILIRLDKDSVIE